MNKGITVEHKGYILQQGSTCLHYMIFKADTNEWCMHSQCTKYLTEEEAREHIELYLRLIGTPKYLRRMRKNDRQRDYKGFGKPVV